MNQNPYVDATTLPERLSPDPPVKEQAFSGTPARQTWNHAFSDQAPAGYVDGPFLVVQSGTALPNHCLVTNTPLPDQTAQRLTFNWCSPFIWFLFLIAWPLILLAYLVFRRQCHLWCFIKPQVRQRIFKRNLIKLLAITVSLAVTIGGFAFGMVTGGMVGLGLLFISVIALLVPSSPLGVSKYRDGFFWIYGVHPDVLRGLLEGAPLPRKRLPSWQLNGPSKAAWANL